MDTGDNDIYIDGHIGLIQHSCPRLEMIETTSHDPKVYNLTMQAILILILSSSLSKEKQNYLFFVRNKQMWPNLKAAIEGKLAS